MIKNTNDFVTGIKKAITRKYGYYCFNPMKYKLEWIFNHKVKVIAWQEKAGATYNDVELIISMSKSLIRENEDKLANGMNESQFQIFWSWLYKNRR